MSLIEQAAKRLEELRRAGADLGPYDVLPVARAGEAVADERVRPTPLRGGTGPPRGERDVRGAEEAHETATRTQRHIAVDLASLSAQGFVVPSETRSQIADEFRVAKRPILANASGRGAASVRHGNLVMVTSSIPGEGKTFTAVNLAMSIAMEYDHRVLLVDADVVRPSLPRVFGMPGEPGLLDVLAGRVAMADALIATDVERLTLLPAGRPDRRATELLASEQMAALLREISSRYSDRIIVFDSPPLLGATESRVLASRVGQVLMVVAADQTPQPTVDQALETIDGCEVVLMLLNKAGGSDVADYYGYYGDRGTER